MLKLKILASLDKCQSFTLDTEETCNGRYLSVQINDRVFEIWATKKEPSEVAEARWATYQSSSATPAETEELR